jgi:uncharacterized membrane protein
MSRRNTGWLIWLCVVLPLFNSCANHRQSREVAEAVKHGTWSFSVGFALQAIRSVGTDDGDIERYRAYANAMLGRSYPVYYVRAFNDWRIDEIENDPEESAIVSSAPLAPYRDFSVEYPPGFLPIALAPALVFGDLDGYALAFSVLMALALTLALWMCTRAARKLDLSSDRLVMLSAISAFALGVICVRRYDAVVSVAATGLVWGVVGRRPVVAGLAVGVGVAAKGVPLLLAPFAIVTYARARRWREAVIASAVATFVVALAVLPFAASPLFDIIRYHGERPLQIESTWGALLSLAKPVLAVTPVQTFGSLNVVSDFDGPLRLVASVTPWLAWLALLVHALRARLGDRELLRVVVAALVAYMVLGKVFSPQYVTWLLPLGALASLAAGRTERILFVCALALTQIIYPFLYLTPLVWGASPLFGLIVLVRNGLLAAWAVRLLCAPTLQ